MVSLFRRQSRVSPEQAQVALARLRACTGLASPAPPFVREVNPAQGAIERGVCLRKGAEAGQQASVADPVQLPPVSPYVLAGTTVGPGRREPGITARPGWSNHGAADELTSELEEEGETPVDPDASPPKRPPFGAESATDRVARHLAARVPPTLRGGVVDPGKRAVGALTVVGLVAALLAGVALWRSRPEPVAVPARTTAATAAPTAATAAPTAVSAVPTVAAPAAAPRSAAPTVSPDVVVDVGGKIHDPGVYTLPAGSRVIDAVKAAGGIKSGADTTGINLARQLNDGEKILVGVPRPPKLAGPRTSGSAAPAESGAKTKINLNTAPAQELEELPGIGPVLSQRIVDYRAEHGGFGSLTELKDVSGIGDATFADLEGEVTV